MQFNTILWPEEGKVKLQNPIQYFCYSASLAKIIIRTISHDRQIHVPSSEKESSTQDVTRKIRAGERKQKGLALDCISLGTNRTTAPNMRQL